MFDRIKVAQIIDPQLQKIKSMVKAGVESDFRVHDDGILWFRHTLCVPNESDIKGEILYEVHNSGFTVHPRSTKMYMDLKETFWWNNMKREVA